MRAELNLPLENVVVVKFGDQPLQRDAARTTAIVMVGVIGLGVLWIILRFRRRRPEPPPLPTTFRDNVRTGVA